ncbi:MAG TPA: paraquat-inducible protein A [Candidatus Polarisedimenticolaceae bacterium]|nr:paraquat-inducible protein A [Candidatus Polarisedimenticolaceae bacterium]
MKIRNVVALGLVLLSFGLLVPGLILPLITIRASFNFMGNTIDVFNQTRSIVQSIKDLHESGNDFVAGLILLFSVLVPLFKGALLGAVALARSPSWRRRLFVFVRGISKWAMADVFAVGVYVAFLAAKASENLDARVGTGFYWFVAYCLVSLAALQFMWVAPANPPSSAGGRAD